jgi:hypothetical protein
MSAPVAVADVKFAHQIERLHRLGPRAVAELLAEIGARHLIRQPIEATVERYVARLDPEMLAATGGVIRFPRTRDGRDLLRYFLAGFRSSPLMRLYIATEGDWDLIAEDQRDRGKAIPRARRGTA